MATEKELWKMVQEEIAKVLGFSDFAMNLWFGGAELEKLTDKTAYISIKEDFQKDIIDSKYINSTTEAFKNVLGFEVTPIIISTRRQSFEDQLAEMLCSDEEISQTEDDNKINDQALKLFNEYKQIMDEDLPAQSEIQLPSFARVYTFENFVVGKTNTFAHATCRGMALDAKCSYNPLFIYGPPGLGKTHLLNAVIREVSIRRQEAKIVYVKCEDFTNELIAAISSNSTPAFREKYRTADLLLVDDIQFIGGKNSTQEEYFHTFNTLYESEKQIIMASDRPPKSIANLEERLRSRFEQGMITDIQPPDLELRIAIFKRKAQSMGINIPNDVLLFLGDAITDNIRQIEGVITKMKVMSFLRGEPMSLDLARKVVSEITTPNLKPKVLPEDIIKKVASEYSLQVEDLLGKKQSQNIVKPRHIAVFLIRNLLSLSLPDIGKIFNRNHTTIMSSIEKVENWIKLSSDFSSKIEALKKDVLAK